MYRTADVCFMCKTQSSCTVVDDKIFGQVEYLLPEIGINNLGRPLHICSTCGKYLDSFCKFKQKNVQKNLRLEANNSYISIKENFSGHEFNEHHDIEDESATQGRGNHNFEEHINTEPTEENSISFESCTEKSEDNISIKEEFNDNVVYVRDKNESMNDNNISSSKVDQGTNEYECPICHEFFMDSETLITHMKRSHTTILTDIQKARCPICNKIQHLCNLKRHLKSHVGIKDFHCSICNDLFSTKETLKYHMKIHSGKKEVQCLICKKNFLTEINLKKHMKTHNKKKDDTHCETYNDENQKRFSVEENLENDITIDKSISICFECPTCHKLFAERKNLLRHIESHTGIQSGKKSVKCSICSKFISQYNLKRHLKYHAGVKNFHCSICKKSFSQKVSLKDHLTTHAKIKKKDFECDICHKKFKRKNSLTRHTETHNLNEKHHCSICNETFAQINCLHSHIRIHMTNQLHTISVDSEINSAATNTENKTGEIISPSQKAETENCNDLELNNIFITEEPIEEDSTSDSYSNKNEKHIGDENVSLGRSRQKLKENLTDDTEDESATQRRDSHNFEDHMEENSISFESCVENSADNISLKEELTDNVEQVTDKDESMNDNNIGTSKTNEYECPICHEYFIDSENLIIHMKRSHTKILTDIQKARCPICDKIQHLCNLKRHLKSHVGIKDFHCSVCKKSFTTKGGLQYHMTTHAKIKKKEFKCDICHKQFMAKCSLAKHKESHNLKEKHPCPVCNETFTDESCFQSHFRTHITNQLRLESVITEVNSTENENGEIISPGLKARTENSNDLERNNIAGQDDETTIQERSDQKFKEIFITEDSTSSESYFNGSKKHIKNKSEENFADSQFYGAEIEDILVKDESIKENSNDREFYDKILQDVVKNENITDNNINCSEVLEEISNEVECNDNVQQDTKYIDNNINCTDKVKANYECPTCYKIFTESEHLMAHLKTHINTELDKNQFDKKKIQCPICSKFVHTRSMKKHLKSHVGIKDFHCSICNKSFSAKENLKYHMTTHAQIRNKEFKCDICRKQFMTKSNMTRHTQIHNLNEKHQLHIESVNNEVNCATPSTENENEEIISPSQKALMEYYLERTNIADKDYETAIQERSDQKFKEIFITEDSTSSESYFNDSKKHIKNKSEIEEDISVKDESIEEDFNDRELYNKILQDIMKDENITDNNINFSEVSEEISNEVECNDNVQQDTKYIDNNINCTDKVKANFECPTCYKIFTESEHLMEHLKTHVNIKFDKKKIQCPICSKFVHTRSMKRHFKSHVGIKDFHCFVCKKSFSEKKNLKYHLTTHAKVKKKEFECDICHKQFMSKQYRNRHIKIHKRKL